MRIFIIYSAILFFSVFTCGPLAAQTPLLFGMTSTGGSHDSGAIFIFNPSNNTENVVWSFGGGTDGTTPYGDLVYDVSKGLFYGMTLFGGSHHKGVIIGFNPSNNAENVRWNFGNGADGANPYGNLVYDVSDGLFYGTTYYGGSNNLGTIINFNPTSDTENVVWSFGRDTDGARPQGNLVYDNSNGLFYGITPVGGSHSLGAIINFNPANNTENVGWSFGRDTDGAGPVENLVYDAGTGLFYGMTDNGGSHNYGAITSFNPINNVENMLWSFGNGTDGQYPNGGFVYDASNGLFYGTTFSGGSHGLGTIISFNPTNNTENVVWNFGSGTDGSNPGGNLVYYADNGLFYGMTWMGGSHDSGAIISFNPTNNTENVVWSFGAGIDGKFPTNGSLVLYYPDTTTGINTLSNVPVNINVYPNPANTLLTITGLNVGQTVELYNYIGQKVIGLIVDNVTQQLNISEQANGIYLVHILNADRTVVCEKKVVKINE